jgi:hypothetical protein
MEVNALHMAFSRSKISHANSIRRMVHYLETVTGNKRLLSNPVGRGHPHPHMEERDYANGREKCGKRDRKSSRGIALTYTP